MSDVEVSLMKEEDIDGAIATVQQAFAEDPYNKWIYNVRENVRLLSIFTAAYSSPTAAKDEASVPKPNSNESHSSHQHATIAL